MARSNISFILTPDNSREEVNRELREIVSFGPHEDSEFSSQLVIAMANSFSDIYKVRMIVDGHIRVIENPSESSKVSLFLSIVSNEVQRNLSTVLGDSTFVFIYSNVSRDSVRQALQGTIENLDYPWLTGTLEERINAFMRGSYSVPRNAGDEIGKCGTWRSEDVAVGFEIVYLPAALWRGVDDASNIAGWNRTKELIQLNQKLRRFDPTAFFYKTRRSPSNFRQIASPLTISDIVGRRILAGRILLELRDEYDEPYEGSIQIGEIEYNFQRSQWGILILNNDATDLPSELSFTISKSNYYLTELPSGSTISTNQDFQTRLPIHKAFQLIYLNSSDETSPDDWFSINPGFPRFTPNNTVEFIIDGKIAMAQIGLELSNINQAGHTVYFCNWMAIKTSELYASRFLEAELQRISDSGANIYALIWESLAGVNISEFMARLRRVFNDQYGGDLNRFLDELGSRDQLDVLYELLDQVIQLLLSEGASGIRILGYGYAPNKDFVDSVNSKANGIGVLDRHPDFIGIKSHHQKSTIINGSRGGVAFCGGIDFTESKANDIPGHRSSSASREQWHDVHAQIIGPAVLDLYRTFAYRWNVSFSHQNPLLPESISFGETRRDPIKQHFVSVTRTHNITLAPGPKDFSTVNALKTAIRRAKKFIYFEEQYLTPYFESQDSPLILDDLRFFLRNNPNGFILALITDSRTADEETVGDSLRKVRSQLINELREIDRERVLVFRLHEIYVHSKVVIIDDVFVKVGSSNLNRRSLTADSECDINVIDGSLLFGRRRLAFNLRVDLWCEHLNLGQERKYLLYDPHHSLYFWRNPPRNSRIRNYRVVTNTEFTPDEQRGWSDIFDEDALNTYP